MSWNILIVFLGLAFFGNALEIEPEDLDAMRAAGEDETLVQKIEPEDLDAMRAAGEDETLAQILGIDAKFLRPDDSEQRFEGSIFSNVSHLGDIMLTDEQARSTMNFRRAPLSKWLGGTMPYVVSNGFNDQQKQQIQAYARNFNLRVRSVRLVPRTTQEDYIFIFNGRGCWSYLGRIRGPQAISLQANGCLQQGVFQHEVMHAAGFHHEHNRFDRYNHVQILWNNIPREWWSQYQRVNPRDFRDIGLYDYESVMHYPMWAPGNPSKDAFALPYGVDRNIVGQRDGLSKDDVDKLNEAYCH